MAAPIKNAAHVDQRAQTRLGLGAALIPLFFAVGFAACIIGSYHKPHPNDIEFAVVGPPEATAPLVARLQQGAGSAFDISQVATVAEAEHDVSQRDLNAAFVPTTDPKQPATVIVASANGRIVATAAETLARNVTAAQGAQLAVDEVRPLASGDELGLAVFLFIVVCTICGYLTPTVLETLAPALLPNRRYPIIAATSLLVPTLVVLIGGLAYGTLRGLLRDDPRVHRRRCPLHVHHRPRDASVPGAARATRDPRVTCHLRVPQHREPGRHLHAARDGSASGSS